MGAQRPDICQLVQKKRFFCTTDFVWFVLTAQKELEAPLWICFTPAYEFLIVKKKICFLMFFIENKSVEKKLMFFHVHLLGNLYIGETLGENPKCVRFFFDRKFFDEKIPKNIFFQKKSKIHILE